MFNGSSFTSFKKLLKEVIKAGILIFLLSLLFNKFTGDPVFHVALHLIAYSVLWYIANAIINYVKSKRTEE